MRDASYVAGREVLVDRRSLFTAQLPNGKCVLIKAKLSKSVRDMLRPVAFRYELALDSLAVFLVCAGSVPFPL